MIKTAIKMNEILLRRFMEIFFRQNDGDSGENSPAIRADRNRGHDKHNS